MKKLFCLLGCLITASAQATVIDFEDIWLPNLATHSANLNNSEQYISGGSVTSRGFQLSSTSNWLAIANYPSEFAGPSTSFLLLNDNTGWHTPVTRLTLAATDGHLFSLAGFDISSWGFEESASEIQVTGQSSAGTKTLTLKVNNHENRFMPTTSNLFQDWSNLSSVSFNSLSSVAPNGGSYNWAIDNIRVDTGHSVPEPASLALVGLGLASMGLVARRRRKM